MGCYSEKPTQGDHKTMIDLSDIISPDDLAKLKAKAEARRSKPKAKPKAQTPAQAEAVRFREKPTPWVPEALVLQIAEIHCTCGSVHRTPASSAPFVRFRHKRNGGIWEVDNHPSAGNPQLPRDTRVHIQKVAFCQDCWERTTFDRTTADLFISDEGFDVMSVLNEAVVEARRNH